MTLLSALEIFTNPYDLCFSIIAGKLDGQFAGKYALMISRGPQHNYKPIVTSEFSFESAADALQCHQELLDTIHKYLKEHMSDTFSNIDNPDKKHFCLNRELVAQIINDLKVKMVADTSSYELPECYQAAI